jgi:hypothetical protein
MRGALLSPRPEPGHLMPALAGGLVLLLALPLFLVAGWDLAGWGLATVLYLAVHALNLLIARAAGHGESPAASGVRVFGVFFKSLGLLVVLIAAAASDPGLALAAALTYALAYTAELGLSLASYFGAPTR